MAEVKKESEAKAVKVDETPEQKADREIHERNQKENEKREKLVGGFVKDLQTRLEEYGGEDLNAILTDLKARVATLYVVAAGADMGTPPPQTVKELMEEHTPYIAPATPPGRTPSTNIALHVAEMDEETRSKKKSKKAA
jgi:hypothetical protein